MELMPRSLSFRLGIPYFLSPTPLAAVGILILNDHYLKGHFPSWWTGKLSDFAGLFFTPLFLCAILNLAKNLCSRPGPQKPIAWISPLQLMAAIVLTDLLFAAIKLSQTAAALYIEAMLTLGFPAQVTPDPTDLMAVSVSSLTYLYGRRFF